MAERTTCITPLSPSPYLAMGTDEGSVLFAKAFVEAHQVAEGQVLEPMLHSITLSQLQPSLSIKAKAATAPDPSSQAVAEVHARSLNPDVHEIMVVFKSGSVSIWSIRSTSLVATVAPGLHAALDPNR